MRKTISTLLACLLLVAQGLALGDEADYTLPTKGTTVLQNMPDRKIAVHGAASAREPAAGESPVTGLPWQGEYLPMLVQIGNLTATAKVNGRDVKASGIGKNSPWGMQYADILYEELITGGGATRFTMLMSDCFARGEPTGGVGPVRSCRAGPLMLREEWQAGLVYGGGVMGAFRRTDDSASLLLAQTGVQALGVLFDTRESRYKDLRYRVKGVKAPNNLNVDVAAMRELIPDTYVSTPHPFLFKDGLTYGDGYATAGVIHLDWGYKYNISHFLYDESANVYLRYCGAGVKAARWALFTTFVSALDRSEESRQPLAFRNVIVQRTAYAGESYNAAMPVVQSVGAGNADIFLDGRYIPGYWVRLSLTSPTVYYDDRGNELQLGRGTTYIADFPPEARCTFSAGV